MFEHIKMAAFVDELEVLKEAGIWDKAIGFLGRGLGQIGAAGRSVASKGVGATLGQYKQMAKYMGPGGFAKAVAPAATVLGGGALAGYGALKGTQAVLGGGQRR